MVNTTTSEPRYPFISMRAVLSKIRALSIQVYLGHNAYMQTDYMVNGTVDKDEWEEARSCFDLGRRAHEQRSELIEEFFALAWHTKNYRYYYDELTAIREKYRPSHWL